MAMHFAQTHFFVDSTSVLREQLQKVSQIQSRFSDHVISIWDIICNGHFGLCLILETPPPQCHWHPIPRQRSSFPIKGFLKALLGFFFFLSCSLPWWPVGHCHEETDFPDNGLVFSFKVLFLAFFIPSSVVFFGLFWLLASVGGRVSVRRKRISQTVFLHRPPLLPSCLLPDQGLSGHQWWFLSPPPVCGEKVKTDIVRKTALWMAVSWSARQPIRISEASQG